MPLPDLFAAFDFAGADVAVWTFKKSGGLRGAAPVFNGRWVATTAPLDVELKRAIQEALEAVAEVQPYGLLAAPLDGGALAIDADETFLDLIVEATANPLPQRRASDLTQIQNSDFYVIKLTSDGNSLYAFRKTDSSWRSKKRRQVIDTLFADETLTLETRPAFSMSKQIDFVALGGTILILGKSQFESVMNYRQAHADEFVALQTEAAFAGLFTSIAPLVAFVGTNKIQLRRACAIKYKGHYLNPAFTARLREHHAAYHLTVNFTPAGLIDPTAETCRDIITALLDHRLTSAFSEAIYDVPDATKVV